MRLKFDDLDSRIELSAFSNTSFPVTATSTTTGASSMAAEPPNARNIMDRSISVSRTIKPNAGGSRKRSQSTIGMEALYLEKKRHVKLLRSRLALHLIIGYVLLMAVAMVGLVIDFSERLQIGLWVLSFIVPVFIFLIAISPIMEKFHVYLSTIGFLVSISFGLPLCFIVDDRITDGPIMTYFLLAQLLLLCAFSKVSLYPSVIMSWLMVIVYLILSFSYEKYSSLEDQISILLGSVSFAGICTLISIFVHMMQDEDDAFHDHNNGIIRSMYHTMKTGVETNTLDLNLDPPILSAISTLRQIALSPNITDQESDELVHIMHMLQSGSDIYSPLLNESANGEPQYVDPDTHNLLVSFVGAERGGTYLGSFAASHIADMIKGSSASPSDSPYSTMAWRTRAASMQGKRSYNKGRAKRSRTNADRLRQGFFQIIQNLVIHDVWNIDTIELSTNIDGRPLQYISMYYLESLQLVSSLNIPIGKLENFLSAVEMAYNQNPYHNSIHAADVVNSFCYLLNPALLSKYNDLEIFAGILAAIIHDTEHDGRTNAFHVLTGSQRALVHNDRSVQEHHHLTTAFRLLYMEENNFLQHLPTIERKSIRDIVIDLVLSTDMSKHFELVNIFKNKVGGQGLNLDDREDKLLMLKILLKCADIGHSAKRLEVHEKWTARITEEFYQQGDEERRLSIPISTFMDRSSPLIEKSQVGFLEVIALPLFTALSHVNGDGQPVQICLENHSEWVRRMNAAQNPQKPALHL